MSSSRRHYEPLGAPVQIQVPWKHLDPYTYPSRIHRTGDTALDMRMSTSLPPAWGPEMQHTLPIECWKKEVNTWYMASTAAEKNVALVHSRSSRELQRLPFVLGCIILTEVFLVTDV